MAKNIGSKLNVATMACKAGNTMCTSLHESTNIYSLRAMDCDICCSEDGFCCDCCCILCAKTISLAHGGYSFIKCEAKVNESYICGHMAHINCAFRSYMAGTVGGSISLDMQYFCRRCDHRTDLTSHVTKLIKTCKTLDSRDDIETILKVGYCILHGSQQEFAKRLMNSVKLALKKITDGVDLNDIWNGEGYSSVVTTGATSHPIKNGIFMGSNTNSVSSSRSALPKLNSLEKSIQQPVFITSDYMKEEVKLEKKVDQILQNLRRSQEVEYKMAKDKLYAQKDFIVGLYQQLDAKRSELARSVSATVSCDVDELLTNVSNRVDQIRQEDSRLNVMAEVGKGFGRTPRDILEDYFDLHIED